MRLPAEVICRVSFVRCRLSTRAHEPTVTRHFECKQALPGFARDNCKTAATRERLRSLNRRRLSCKSTPLPYLPSEPRFLFANTTHPTRRIGNRGTVASFGGHPVQNRLWAGRNRMPRRATLRKTFSFLPTYEFAREPDTPAGGASVERLDRPSAAPPAGTTTRAKRVDCCNARRSGTRQFNRTLPSRGRSCTASSATNLIPISKFFRSSPAVGEP